MDDETKKWAVGKRECGVDEGRDIKSYAGVCQRTMSSSRSFGLFRGT